MWAVSSLSGISIACGATLAACASSSVGSTVPAISEVPLGVWDGGDAACSVERAAVQVGCATGHRIMGDPNACVGFSDGTGNADTCERICGTVSGCTVTGLSDGTSAVVCLSHCSNNAH
jgi:hypothetical protein